MSQAKEFANRHCPFAVNILKGFRNAYKSRNAKRRIHELLKANDEIKVEVGSGNRKGIQGWITLDMCAESDLFWDLRNGLPFPDSSLSKVYSSHFLEHLSYQEGQAFLAECLRALKPEGVISICVPNAQIYLEAYVTNKKLDHDTYFTYGPAYRHTSRMDYVNYTAYMDGEHKYMFDRENLLYLLTAKGFRDARMRDFDPSIDRQARDYESLYAEAYK